jgi:uncharacterized membrane protein
MNKTRLEAFSDGVFAIVITLLILDISIPNVDYAHLPQALKDIFPDILAYVMSFIVIGLYWVSHHNSFQLISKVNRGFLWLNILLLLFISFMPFPTLLLGKYPFKQLPVIIYGCNILAANLTGFVMMLYIWYCPGLKAENFTRVVFKRQLVVYLSINSVYIIAVLVSFINPTISYYIYGSVFFALIILFGKDIGRMYQSN